MKRPGDTDATTNVQQYFDNCRMTYDLTEHSITVVDDFGDLLLKVWRLRDNPGGFSLADDGTSIEINNPTGIVFVPVESEPV